MFRLSTTSVRLKSSKPACFFINYKVNKENSVLTQIRTARKDSCVSGDKTQVRIIKNDGSIYQMNKDLVDSSNYTSTFEESSENATAYLKTAHSFFIGEILS
ncbi:MAG: hypothetical protein ACJA1H_002636 [Glaciecola sp.]|jgi:hypothetical protein